MNLGELEQTWLAVMRMAVDAKKQTGVDLTKCFALLRDAKPLLNECHLDEEVDPEILRQAEELILQARRLATNAGDAIGAEFMDKWAGILEGVIRGEKIGEFPVSRPSFHPGMPKGRYVKISPSSGLDAETIVRIAQEKGLQAQEKNDEYILIGDEEKLREALNEMRLKLKEKAK